MNSPTTAYIWELWRRSRWQLLGRLTIVVAYILCLSMILRESNDEPTRRLMRGLILLMLIPSNIYSPTWMGNFVSGEAGFPFRHGFVRPVKTRWLVIVPVIFAAFASIVVYNLQAAFLWALVGESLPHLLPSLIVGCGVTWVIASLWIPTTPTGRVLAIASVVVVFSIGAYFFHGAQAGSDTLLMAVGRADYFAMSWQLNAALLVSAVVAVAATVTGVERQRHGDSLIRLNAESRVEAAESEPISTSLLPAWPRSKHQAFSAQFWMEWKRCRMTILAMTLIAPTLLFLMQMLGPMLSDNWHGSAVIWVLALVTCPFVYQMVTANAALGGQPDGSIGLTQFDFIRPMPCDQMMAIKMLVVFVFSLLGWLFMAFAAGLHTLTGPTDSWTTITELVQTRVGSMPVSWWFLGGVCWLLLFVCSTSTLFAWMLLAGRYLKVIWAGTAFFMANLVLVAVGARHEWNLKPLFTSYGYIGAVLIVAVCAYVLRRSIHSPAIGRPLLVGVACFWIVFVGSISVLFANANPPTPVPFAAIVFGAACLLVPLAAAVSSPLALALHRHE